MTTALEMFRQQKAALAELQQQARSLDTAIASVRSELTAIANHDGLRTLLVDEQRWLQRTEDAVREVRAWRADEGRHPWWQFAGRWVVAMAFALLASSAAGAGYVWAARPYAEEIDYLRSRESFASALETRMLRMTPAERAQLETLLKLAPPKAGR
jgi:hypothetical protein